MTLSTAYWPALKYTPTECVSSDDEHMYWKKDDKNSCKEWYKSNTVYLEIYYERMNYQSLTESEAYAVSFKFGIKTKVFVVGNNFRGRTQI